ncbi:MAG: hypothetical protein J6S02_06090 [Bacteroidaceae bacterium]|nr:hypothetical protein [Bacteroidaceae bacterium]
MTTIDTYLQQKNEEFLRLEIAYSNLYRAYMSGNVDSMKYQYDLASQINIPFFANSIQSHTKLVMLSNNVLPTATISIYAIQNKNEVFMNVQGCLNAIHEELGRRNIYTNQYTYAQSVLYRPAHAFKQEEVLYQNTQGSQLKVADLLAVSKYAVSIAEAINPSNEEYAKANAAITVFQSIDAILNNKPEDKPINKMLHLATSFISSVVKSSIKYDEAKRGVTITAIMVDLVIDFFCKK